MGFVLLATVHQKMVKMCFEFFDVDVKPFALHCTHTPHYTGQNRKLRDDAEDDDNKRVEPPKFVHPP